MPKCRNCNAYVSKDFVRIFGDNDDEVYGCLECVGATAVKNGATKQGVSRRSDSNHPAIGGAD
jgi:hypothetical protein